MRLSLTGLSLVCLAACGAAAEPDPLAEDEVADISSQVGSATGERYSGIYLLTATPTGCDCPTIEGGDEFEDIDICDQLTVIAWQENPSAAVLHTGGFLRMSIDPDGEFTGAVELDGSFVLGSITNFSQMLSEGKRIGRMEGAFGSAAEAGFEAALGQRVILDSPLLEETLDCRADFDIVGTYQP